MKYLFLQYPPCSTCRKAKQWLDDNGVSYESRHIVAQTPDIVELGKWAEQSGLPLKAFFNTHGLSYKALNLKERLPGMSSSEQLSLLSADGKLIKRPLLVGNDFVLIGFDALEWAKKLK